MERNDLFQVRTNNGEKLLKTDVLLPQSLNLNLKKDSICFACLLSNRPIFKLHNDIHSLYNEIILLPVLSQNASWSLGAGIGEEERLQWKDSIYCDSFSSFSYGN